MKILNAFAEGALWALVGMAAIAFFFGMPVWWLLAHVGFDAYSMIMGFVGLCVWVGGWVAVADKLDLLPSHHFPPPPPPPMPPSWNDE